MFLKVTLTSIFCPCVAVSGGSETARACRSGDSSTWTPRGIVTQLFFSEDSATSPGPSAHAWKVYRPGTVSEYTLRVTAAPPVAPASRFPTLSMPLRFFLLLSATLTSQNFVIEAALGATPLFLTVAVAVKVADGSTVSGASVRPVTTRSGFNWRASTTLTDPGALVQLLV